MIMRALSTMSQPQYLVKKEDQHCSRIQSKWTEYSTPSCPRLATAVSNKGAPLTSTIIFHSRLNQPIHPFTTVC
ncbi:hypothetical protein J6590_031598 [Homalodisca vitripennis]|nr:hypothetical protein J6590_031598 [Homalodisca vitripennis]